MEIDFRNLPVRDIEGNLSPRDISKELGNYIYGETSDLGELDLAQRIYKEGHVELTPEEVETVRRYIEKGYKAFIKRAFNEVINPSQPSPEGRA